jgi:hypothetical protein
MEWGKGIMLGGGHSLIWRFSPALGLRALFCLFAEMPHAGSLDL